MGVPISDPGGVAPSVPAVGVRPLTPFPSPGTEGLLAASGDAPASGTFPGFGIGSVAFHPVHHTTPRNARRPPFPPDHRAGLRVPGPGEGTTLGVGPRGAPRSGLVLSPFVPVAPPAVRKGGSGGLVLVSGAGLTGWASVATSFRGQRPIGVAALISARVGGNHGTHLLGRVVQGGRTPPTTAPTVHLGTVRVRVRVAVVIVPQSSLWSVVVPSVASCLRAVVSRGGVS